MLILQESHGNPPPLFLIENLLSHRIREARMMSTMEDLLMFIDGLVNGQMIGALAIIFQGGEPERRSLLVRFLGHHFSMQA